MREIITNFVELIYGEQKLQIIIKFFGLAKWHRIFSTQTSGSKSPPYAAT